MLFRLVGLMAIETSEASLADSGETLATVCWAGKTRGPQNRTTRDRQAGNNAFDFGNIFSIWDRLFGTLVYDDLNQIRYGLDILDDRNDEDLLYQIKIPFDTSINPGRSVWPRSDHGSH